MILSRPMSLACLLAAGCTPMCPPTEPITLVDGTTVNAASGSGAPSQESSTWAMYAVAAGPTSILGVQILPGTNVLLFRMQFGAGGKLVKIFDNLKLAPDSFGVEIIFDGAHHAMKSPDLTYAAVPYGADNQMAVADFGCLHVYSQIFDVVQTTMEFSGTRNNAADRIDGTLTFITEINPAFASQAPPNAMLGTTRVQAFASRES